jgi:hypothetical protein
MDIRGVIIGSFVFVFLLLFVIKDNVQRFFILVLLGMIGYFYYEKYKKAAQKNNNIEGFLNKIEKDLSDDFEIPENKIFYIHKTPRNIKYIKKHHDIRQILYELKFVLGYDKGLYHKLVSFVEYFLKIHYKVMIDKYEFSLYYPMLVDTRHEILNILKTIYFNIPNISTILSIQNLDEYVEKRIKQLQAITYKLMKLLCQKHKKPFKPPYPVDKGKDSHYALF